MNWDPFYNMNFCFFHKYKKIGEQRSPYLSIEGSPVTRIVSKCKKCNKIKYFYPFLGFDGLVQDWTPEINLNDTLTETRRKKIIKINKKT